jgi:hypothetical protein
MRSKRAMGLVAASVAMGLAACSAPAGPDGTQGTAFGDNPSLQVTQEWPTGRIMNFAALIFNQDDTSLRVRSVRLISPSGPGIHDVKIRALAPSMDEGGQFILQGNLARCPRRLGYAAVPVNRILEPPHRTSDWRLLVSLAFAKPGRYHLYLLKVDYEEAGRRHWDYLRADITVRAISPKTNPSLIQLPC